MNTSRSGAFASSTGVLLLAIGAAAAWLWVCWCMFPVSVWNDVRLAPAFALARGMPLYPGETSGAVGTWIYGPLPLLLLWPATWATSAAHALMTAGAINLFTTVAAIGIVCAMWPAPAGCRLAASDRWLAFALAIALWPRAAFQFLQADNVAVALGLVGNLLLVRARSRVWLWGAAASAVACLACKQTSFGVAAAQILWLGVTGGWKEAIKHSGRCLVAVLAGGLLMFASFDSRGLWFNMFALPSLLPWTQEPLRRTFDLLPVLVIHLVVPALIMIGWRRTIWKPGSALLLPSLTWLGVLPGGLAALMKLGGTLNSLQGFVLWLPAALIVGLGAIRTHRRAPWILAGVAFASIGLCAIRLERIPVIPWRPVTEHYRQAESLARAFPGEIWFPWNPLVTVFSEGRFYHAEDGLYVRFLAGHAITLAHARAHLPSHMCVIGLPRGGTDWGIALSFLPKNARRSDFGWWTLYSWPPAAPAGSPDPPPHG